MAGAEPRAASSNEPRFAPQSRDLRTNGGVRTSSAQVVDDERQLLLAQALLWLLWLLSSAPAPSDPGPTYTQSPM